MIPALSLFVAILAAGPARPQADLSASRPAALPARVLRDVARLATSVPLTVLAAGGGAAAAAHAGDRSAAESWPASARWERALDGGSVLGGGAIQFGLAGAVYAAGLASARTRVAALGSALLEAQIVEGLTAQGLKYAVRRRRPDGGRYSFPSGHASSAFATADTLSRRFGWKVGMAAYAGATYVAASRLTERQHYLSDVVFGAAIGIASARAVRPTGRSRAVTVRPVPVYRGAAVQVTVQPGARPPR